MAGNQKFEAFEPSSEDWDSYLARFEFHLETHDITEETKKRACLLSSCGKDTFDIARSLVAPTEVKTVSFADITKKLKAHFSPQPSEIACRHAFYKRNQAANETIADFVAALRKAARPCNVADVEIALRDRLVCGLRDERLQQRLFAKPTLTWAVAYEEAVAAEAADRSTKEVRQRQATTEQHVHSQCNEEEGVDALEDVNAVKGKRTQMKTAPSKTCSGCGGKHQRDACWARDLECRACGRRGHIARVCRAAKKNPVSKPSERRRSPAREAYSQVTATRPSAPVVNRTSCPGKIVITVLLDGRPCSFEIDSGSSVTIVSAETWQKLFPDRSKRRLQHADMRVSDFQGRRIPLVGRDTVNVEYEGKCKKLSFLVTEGDWVNLLGLDWFSPLGIGIYGVNKLSENKWSMLYERFPAVFGDGLGRYNGPPISFELDPNVAPIRLKYRKVPIPIRPRVEKELDKLIAQGVLEPVPHSRWETPIVTPVKPDGSIRICADYKCTINKALQQHSYPVPVISHVLASLGGGKLFAKLDLAQAYQQLPVTPEAAEAQTIVTHRGAFKVNRLQFGVNVAPGLFQSLMERLLRGVPGTVPYFDDVLIAGKSEQELLDRVTEVLTRFQNVGLKVKRSKCTMGVESVEFLGFRIDAEGVHPTSEKIEAIKNAPKPENKKDLQAKWTWGPAEKRAFDGVKALLTSDAVLTHYDEQKLLILAADASPFGIGAVLSHLMPNGSEAPIAFYSRSLSEAERNYAQIDKEGLALVAAVKKFHDFVFGRKFVLVTDHKPLLGIFAPDKQLPNIMSPRMLRWALFLQAYDFDLEHRPGKAIGHADARGWPMGSMEHEFQPYKTRQNELSISKGCVLWGNRVVVPDTLRQQVLQSLHEGHPGIVQMKALARGYVWWPKMDAAIEEWVQVCNQCQQSRPDPPTAPPQKWESTGKPWSRLHIDFAGPVQGQMFLIIVDAWSKWLEVVHMRSTTSTAVVQALRRLFATHGLPDTLVSDNGPQFVSEEFRQFLTNNGIRQMTAAPFHPASNGQAERMVRTAKEALGRLTEGDWSVRLGAFLLRQHTTPCSTTGRSPAELLMGRRLTTCLNRLHPDLNEQQEGRTSPQTNVRMFREGDKVFARNYASGHLWVPGKICGCIGSRMYTVLLNDGRRWRRHVDQLRKRWAKDSADSPAGSSELVIQPPAMEENEELAGITGQFPESETTDPAVQAPDSGSVEPQLEAPPTEPIVLRRSQRTHRPPAYLADYECSNLFESA
ncbi:PREDICTED: uncharacterized protein K02A2.6-like [Gekko japonicus]|uniref:Gypsy retrotransposon integrase-like protein 1 n=1 Tax=Gekko japonicus TaxID=146911 RepID=A0ABM1L433_GEKJA|nr:PREDICTED: uncharacterized protein K02A2.6-like [Gekko japonicus]